MTSLPMFHSLSMNGPVPLGWRVQLRGSLSICCLSTTKDVGIGELRQEIGLRRIDLNLQRRVVDDLDPGDRVRLAADHVLGADDIAKIGVGSG